MNRWIVFYLLTTSAMAMNSSQSSESFSEHEIPDLASCRDGKELREKLKEAGFRFNEDKKDKKKSFFFGKKKKEKV